jgi:3-hydroxy-9,10-secoandrosta-1,3,5(10)-triene-9,17-dione monooxygenase reductase component
VPGSPAEANSLNVAHESFRATFFISGAAARATAATWDRGDQVRCPTGGDPIGPGAVPPRRKPRLVPVTDLNDAAFRTVLRRFATGVAVVTTWDGELPWGTTVNSFSSVSLRPPLVLVAFDRHRRIVPALRATGRYAVNVLGEEGSALSDCFAGGPVPGGSGRIGRSEAGLLGAGADDAEPPRIATVDREKMCGAAWHPGKMGLPILDDAIASLECTIVEVHPAGDHDLYIARVDSAVAGAGRTQPLLYYSGRYLRIERASLQDLEGKPER